jgi:membrane-bound inhibitor of C-type lysozyme
MKRPYTIVGTILIVLVLGALGVHAYRFSQQNHQASAVIASASYVCRDGKSIDASYTASGVTLTLSDTRAIVLPQAVSASGTRYESGDVTFVTKGDNAFLEEKGAQTFVDCVANGSPATTATASGQKQFTDSAGTFTFMYPSTISITGGGVGYTQDWMVNATSSGLILAKATLDRAFQPKTNFSEAKLTVGTSPDPSAVATCLTYNPSGGPATAPTKQTINGTTYTVMHSNDAAAGNRYDTTSYRTMRNNQCYVIEYTIHSTSIGNYDPSQGIKEFDVAAVTSVMQGIVASFRFSDGAE